MLRTRFEKFSLLVCTLTIVACAGSAATPPTSPTTAEPRPSEPVIGNEAGSNNAAAAAAAKPPPPVTPPEPQAATAAEPKREPVPEAEEKPSRLPVEVLTSPDTAFQINYPNSAPVERARKACSERAGSDDEAIAKCMSDARSAFRADVLRFKRDGNRWACVIYKREGSRLDEVYSGRVELTESSPSSVKLTFTSAEKGVRPLFKSKREGSLRVPNDYSFVLEDPELGRLVYEAKVGLLGG